MLICALLMFSPIYASPKNEKLDVKKSNSNHYYVNSVSDTGWSYTCKDGIEVELLSLGLKNNVPASLTIPNVDNVDHIVVEIVYKGNNPGATIEIEDADGNTYTANREVPAGGSSSVWYYRTELPATASINYNNTSYESKAQSLLAYVFRNENNGIGSSGVFTAIGGYNNIETIQIPITTDSGPRSVSVELPISELTPDGRYVHIEVSASDGSFVELTENINSFPDGQCCIKVFELNLMDVAGDVDEIVVKIDTRNGKNGQSVNGQSWVMGGAVKTNVQCSCVDFDVTPPTADNLVDHILIFDPLKDLPVVTFSDECSDATDIEIKYEAVQSCWVDFGPENATTNISFEGIPFDENHHWDYGYVQQQLGFTPKVIGRVVNNIDITNGWIVEIFFESLVDYNAWIALGRQTDNDALKEQREYANVDFSKTHSFIGFGDYKDSTITLLDTTDPHYIEIGPKAEFGAYGAGFKIAYEGIINGTAIGNGGSQYIEMFAALNRCVNIRAQLIVREWTVTDASGNTQVFTQRVEFEE